MTKIKTGGFSLVAPCYADSDVLKLFGSLIKVII